MPKKAATPKKASTKASSKKDEKKSVHQQFADIVANVDVDADKPKRTKKEVDRFDLEVLSLVPKATRETVFENGTGDALRDIASVAKSIRKHDGDDTVVKKVHQLLYNRPGKTHETKKNILRFSGLPAKGKKEGKERFHSRLTAWKMNDIRAASKLFLLDAGAPKDELVEALVDFLAAPKTPKKVHKKKSSTKKKSSKTTTTSESEAESSAVESESAAESESEKPRGRKRKASPSPKRGKKKTSASPKKRTSSRSRSTSRSRSVSRSRSPARGRSKTKKTSTPTKKRSSTPKRKASQSPKRRAASPSPKRTPTKKKSAGSKTRKSASPSPKKKTTTKKGSAKKPAAKKRKTSKH